MRDRPVTSDVNSMAEATEPTYCCDQCSGCREFGFRCRVRHSKHRAHKWRFGRLGAAQKYMQQLQGDKGTLFVCALVLLAACFWVECVGSVPCSTVWRLRFTGEVQGFGCGVQVRQNPSTRNLRTPNLNT